MTRDFPPVTVNGCFRKLCPLWIGGLLSIIGLLVAAPLPVTAADRQPIEYFEAKVRPLLVEHCYECHSTQSGESSGDLRLDTAAAIQSGGSMGRALVAGKPDESLIVKAISYQDDDLQMPPAGKLSNEAIDVLRQWIAMGAPDPRTQTSVPVAVAPLDRDPQSHWAFVPPQPSVPPSDLSEDARDLIDAVAQQRAEQQGIAISEVASKESLIRRVYYDLTGLPPSAGQVQQFVQSDRPDAYVRLVDDLLASPEFGERFGRHWLDVARYADTVGYAFAGKERRIKGSHRYRDWVINAFATDMPYEEMIVNQLAADRTDPENKQGNLDAMGFLTIGRQFINNLDTLDDQIDVVSRGLLGLTVTCARCHDHKFDPIPSSDYYSLFGVMWSNDRPDNGPSPLMMVDKEKPRDSPILLRGQAGNHGPIAPRQFLTSLRKPDEPRFSDGSGRWELAKRITASDNPLTARVMVNRIWADLIGKPLVDSPSDFGFRTESPKVPEVLDDLAAEFSSHWSIKRIVRRIVLSRIYRQSSHADTAAIAKDPDNQYLARANRKRRDFESLRDSILQVADSLDHDLGGEPIEITQASPTPRRTVYALVDRQNLPSLFRTFDFASPDAHSPNRYFTTVPQQALYLLNNRQIHELAQRTADVVRRSGAKEPSELVVQVFRQVLSRDPTASELAAAGEFLNKPARPAIGAIDPRSLWSYAAAELGEQFAVQSFTPLTVFKDSRWQVGEKIPDDGVWGYASLGKENGHTPRGTHRAVVRRWKAPTNGQLHVVGSIRHPSDQGDGVQATIWAGDQELFSDTIKNSNRRYGPLTATIQQGAYVDLVMSPGENDAFDSFIWRAQIKLVGEDGQVTEADSVNDFSGPFRADLIQPLDRLDQLAQILLMSNEFAFVD